MHLLTEYPVNGIMLSAIDNRKGKGGGMAILTYVSVNLFPIVMLFIIYVNNHKKMSKEPDKIRYDNMTLLTLLLMVTGIIGHSLEGVPGKCANIGLWISYIMYALLVAGIASNWFIYVSCRLQIWENSTYARRIQNYIRGLNLFFAAFVVSTVRTHILFFITEDNDYQQGTFFYLIYLVCVLLLLASILLILCVCRKEASAERRRECYYLLGCGAPPLLGLTMQSIFHDWWVSAPCLSLTILFIYLNTQNHQITIDELTGLNNRREFDQQISKKAEQVNGGNWGMFMLDVDDFKKINDSFGHIVGDEALWETADILRHALGKEKLFLARYGGDEFAVIGEWSNEQEARAAIAAVEDAVADFNKEAGKAYQLSFSIGYAMWNEAEDIEQLVEIADERMYLVKTRKKEAAVKQA